jgi:hypothetical protein
MHDHSHGQELASDIAVQAKALESLLVDNGLIASAALDAIVDHYAHILGTRNDAQFESFVHPTIITTVPLAVGGGVIGLALAVTRRLDTELGTDPLPEGAWAVPRASPQVTRTGSLAPKHNHLDFDQHAEIQFRDRDDRAGRPEIAKGAGKGSIRMTR